MSAYERSSHHGSTRDRYGGRDDRRDRDGPRDRDRDRDGGRDDRVRRRSRSPAGHGSSRRNYDDNAYSSSRGHREREREDRYRDDRGHDRDAGRSYGGHRDSRRDDMPRRDRERDPYDDRRNGRGGGGAYGGGGYGGGGGRRDRDPFPSQGRRSPTPVKVKEPTPDLTGVPSVLKIKRRMTQWDIKPQGYERISAEQAKLSGMFPLPGAPRTQPMDANELQAFMDQPANDVSATTLAPTNSRQSKRLFVDNIPASTTNEMLRDFFNLHMNGLNIVKGRDPCERAQMDPEKTFALLEFKTAEDATYALTLSGVHMQASADANGVSNGQTPGLAVRRPKAYIAPTATEDSARLSSTSHEHIPDSVGNIAVTSIPLFIEGEELRSIFTAFGELKYFAVVTDTGTGQSRGVAFCEYNDQSLTKLAIEQLNGLELGEDKLRVQLACQGTAQMQTDMSIGGMQLLATQQDNDSSRVLCFLNMVTIDELADDDEYADVCEDVKEECAKFGSILDMKVPRPVGNRSAPGLGKIYIKYNTPEEAKVALQALAGRNFANRTVVVTYFDEEYFDIAAW